MHVRTVFSGVVAAGLTFALMPLGCGGAQEEYRVVSRPQEISAMYPSAPQRESVEIPEAIRRQLKACIDRRAGQWSERSYAIQYDAKANDRGEMMEVKLRGSTMQDDEVEGCLRRTIATITLPESALHLRSSRPFSGGERMMRERRGPIGSSDSENPILLLGPIILETIGVDVLIEVGIAIVAAVGTIADLRKKDPKEECLDKYEACMDTKFASKDGDVRGTSRCAWCRRVCVDNKGVWPPSVEATRGPRSCQFPGWLTL